MSASRFYYWLLLNILGLPLLLLFCWQGWRSGASQLRRYPKERLGFVPERTDNPQPIWFHAASVGEVNGIIPLIKALRSAHPEHSILLTTTTISGFQNAQRHLPEIDHRFLPFDFRHAVRRFIRRVQPQQLIVMETEIWPTLFRECGRHDVPIHIINGRLSHKTLSSPAWLRCLYHDALCDVTAIAARSDADRMGFITLGATSARCQTLGNIKYAASVAAETPAPITEMVRPTVVAASTRDGEELIIAQAWQRATTGEHLLVIVPRHPERLIDILKDLANYNVAIRSRGELPTEQSEIYLADTFGELKSFMAHSELVIMGGSFVAKGGQNLIEPAAMGKAIIVGPHMENFTEETRDLLARQGIIQVNKSSAGGSSEELTQKLSERLSNLLGDPEQRNRLGERANQFVVSHADVLERYMAFIESAIQPDQLDQSVL